LQLYLVFILSVSIILALILGMIFHQQAGTCYDQPMYTKFEVCIYTRYEDMKGGTHCRKWGGLGWLVVAQGRQ